MAHRYAKHDVGRLPKLLAERVAVRRNRVSHRRHREYLQELTTRVLACLWIARTISNMTNDVLRILAVDPGTRHMGVAIVQGEELLYYAVKSFKEKRPAYQLLKATRDLVLQLIEDYRPRVLA